MKTLIAKLIGAAPALWVAATFAAETPKGWFPAGSHPKDYEMTIDRKVTHGGKASASLQSIAAAPAGFGTLMQSFKADAHRGQRVRMSGFVRAKGVADWAGLWMRVDGTKNEMLSFDNMQERAVKGTSDWRKYEIVLDVPDAAEQIAFGVLLTGKGQLWLDDLKFEVVGKDVPTTGGPPKQRAPQGPKNLDFEE
jgi:hypothetical protein